jgi:hypothetical protein
MDTAIRYGSEYPTILLGTQDRSFDAVSSVGVNQLSVRLAGCRECLLRRNIGSRYGLFEGSLPVFAGETDESHWKPQLRLPCDSTRIRPVTTGRQLRSSFQPSSVIPKGLPELLT